MYPQCGYRDEAAAPQRDNARGACYADQREVADMDDPAVSRRQFFRGLAGDLLRVVGEVTGLADEEPEQPKVFNLTEGDVVVPPEKQEAALNDLFGFLEQLGAQKPEEYDDEARARREGPVEPA